MKKIKPQITPLKISQKDAKSLVSQIAKLDTSGILSEALNHTHGKPIKKVPMRKEWLKLYHEVDKVADECIALKRKTETLRLLLWSTIESDLGIYDKQLQISDDCTEISIMEQTKEE